MLLLKQIIPVTITAGTGAANTERIKGRVEQLLVIPLDSGGSIVTNSQWSLDMTDSDNDVINRFIGQYGRMDNRYTLNIGHHNSEKLTLSFTSVTNSPATMRVIMKIREDA